VATEEMMVATEEMMVATEEMMVATDNPNVLSEYKEQHFSHPLFYSRSY
jgi:hypothetical protein